MVKKCAVTMLLVMALMLVGSQNNQAEAEAGSDGWVVNIRTYLSIRESPSVHSRELDRIPNGTYVYVLNRVGDFYYVEYGKNMSKTGYAYYKYIRTNW